MSIEIKVPSVGESITEVTVSRWLKTAGEHIASGEAVAEIETDKVTLEIPAPGAGILSQIMVTEGQNTPVGAVLGLLEPFVAGVATSTSVPAPESAKQNPSTSEPADQPLAPAVRRLVQDNQLSASTISASGKGGRLTKADVLQHLATSAGEARTLPDSSGSSPLGSPGRSDLPPSGLAVPPTEPQVSQLAPSPERQEERIPFSRLRLRIAERLKQAQNTAAILTTFNEVDMSELMALRERHRAKFEKTHGVRLGLVSLFVKASAAALRKFPVVNAAIDGREIVYRNYYDIGVAVGTDRGLVVPVLRSVEHMTLADIERKIADFGKRAREGRLALEELSGGTFTISNGGVYGSLLSTPILNPPQSGILGLHKTQDRPVAVDGRVEVRKMMFIALSYDHRIIDGREAVSFLVHVKECIEEPQRLLLDL